MCLGALMLGDATGYEIRKLYEDGPFTIIHKAGYGSIYPALQKLLDEGAVTVTDIAQDRRPDKKVYSLTATGRARFLDSLNTDPAPDRFKSETLFFLRFAHLLPVARQRVLVDDYIARNRALLAEMERAMADDLSPTPGRRLVCGAGRAVYQALIDYLEEYRRTMADGSASPDGESQDE